MKPHKHRSQTRGAGPAWARIATTALATLIVAACNPSPHSAQTTAAADATDPMAVWPQVEWPLAEDAALEKRIADVMATMSVEQKVGQIVQGDIASVTPDDVRRYHLGSILAGGNSDPGGKYNASPAEWLALADAFYDASMQVEPGKTAIPVLFGIDAIHGQSNIVGATLFPQNIALGATRNPQLMHRIGEITAAETRVTGMEWAFAPTVAVPQDDRWGRAYEGYSESPDVVASFAGAMVEGLQGKVGSPEFLDQQHVIVSVKHFLGDGGTTDGKDQGDTVASDALLSRIHNAGYPPAIAAGAQTVMASFNSVNGEKMTGHKRLLTDVLKGRMQFGGFVVSDWNAQGQIKGCSNDNCPAAVNAGIDMVMAPDTWKGFYESTLAAVKSGEISAQRLDEAVSRILRVKLRLGLFEAGKPSSRALGGKFELLGAPEHRAVARQAVRESLVLLKNQNRVLPLNPKQTLLVAGDGADNMSKQTGGWTLNWQGTGTTRADFPNADTIYEGIARQAKAAGGQALLSVDGRYTQKPDAAIVVFGENPYAEFQGDLPNLLYKPGNDEDLELIKRLRAEGIPVVAVFLSGRPLWTNREINAADAFVAAWLPGSEGEGVADVLLAKVDGSVQHDFRGKLSFSWPRTAVQYQNNVGQDGYDPQFAFGHGLTYADDGNLAALPEQSGVQGEQAVAGVYLQRGLPSLGFLLRMNSAQGSPVQVTSIPAAMADGSVKVIGVDHEKQEDARRISWSGAERASVNLMSASPVDISREANGDLMLVMTLRAEKIPDAPVTLAMGCGSGCEGELDIRDGLAKLPANQWTRLGVPLKCMTSKGVDASKINEIWRLQTSAPMQLSLSRIALGALNEVDASVDCSAQ